MINKKSSLAKRMQVSYESKESRNTSRKSVLDWKKVDGEVTFFKPVEGKNRINIIPYVIKTKNHPLVKKGEFSVGDSDYVMDFFIHKSVGPTESSVLCLKSTFGKPCPVCELQAKLRKEGKEDEAKALKPSRRVAYNIEDTKEPGKLKVFETSHYLFEKELIDEARDDEENGFVDFADPEEGKEVKFRASKTSQGEYEFLEFKSFGFEDRDEKISSKLLKQAISFDEILTIPTYEEVEKILYGAEDSEDDEDEPKKKSSKKSSKEDSDDEEEEEDEKPSKSKKEVIADDEEEEDSDDSGDEENDDEEEEEEEKKPSKKSSKDDEEDSDDEPKKKCPFGHKYGVDTDVYDDCDTCDCWANCTRNK